MCILRLCDCDDYDGKPYHRVCVCHRDIAARWNLRRADVLGVARRRKYSLLHLAGDQNIYDSADRSPRGYEHLCRKFGNRERLQSIESRQLGLYTYLRATRVLLLFPREHALELDLQDQGISVNCVEIMH